MMLVAHALSVINRAFIPIGRGTLLILLNFAHNSVIFKNFIFFLKKVLTLY